ncbi:MAG: hypothetical protein JWM57_28 [Phycisphaerales bacterium]|nr:hypothetical protein [Phycisphaerales bacterium]
MKSIAQLVSLRAASLTLVALVGGCAQMNDQPVASAGQAKEIIICSVKPDADPALVLAAAQEIAHLPRVLDVSGGYDSTRRKDPNPTTAPAETVTLIVSFRDDKDLAQSLIDTQYMAIKSQKIGALCSEVKTYQMTLQNYQVATTYTEENTAATLQRRAAAIKQQNELRGQTK